MDNVTLPVGIQTDIEDTFCFSQERGYQDRCHEYIDRYEVPRPWRRGNTAVQSVVEHLCERAFIAGSQMTSCDRPTEPDRNADDRPARMTRSERGEWYGDTLANFISSGKETMVIPVMENEECNTLASGLRSRASRKGLPVIVMSKNRKIYLAREES